MLNNIRRATFLVFSMNFDLNDGVSNSFAIKLIEQFAVFVEKKKRHNECLKFHSKYLSLSFNFIRSTRLDRLMKSFSKSNRC